MPVRKDINSILIIGSGPIVIGQACEFDYSGVQALKSLKSLGFRTVLVNSNPATIMTDPEFADRTYIEPLTVEIVEKIIERERCDALLPTLGGQTALNLAMALGGRGILEKYRCKLIGASLESIQMAENRELFKKAMSEIGLKTPESGYAKNLNQALEIADKLGYPLVIRPSFTLGGHGGGIAFNRDELQDLTLHALKLSPVGEVLIEKSVMGWKEYELEVMRDMNDNCVVVCAIENFDPMGVHTGDSITVAPSQTLTDKEYQAMRDAAIWVMRKIGVSTGGSNIQFAVNPKNGEMLVIEMNPRVSRSSALASKATGFPIAKIAAKLAVGLTLDEIPNDITGKTCACFEPAIDYVAVKFPRFTFEKFPQTKPQLTTQMKSVGEVMAIGRNFKEALLKAIRSLDTDKEGLDTILFKDRKCERTDFIESKIREGLLTPNPDRIFYIADAFRCGFIIDEVFRLTRIDPWFLKNIQEIVFIEKDMMERGGAILGDPDFLLRIKRAGFSNRYISKVTGIEAGKLAAALERSGISRAFKIVDTCAGEFEAETPYYYSTAAEESDRKRGNRETVIILGSGPNRIGQGIEFDYCCVHCVFAAKEMGYDAVMVNCNPETVSTDYDISDRLYFEPLALEDLLEIVRRENPRGVILQFGGQTPLKLAGGLKQAGVKILGTDPDAIDMAEDRERFSAVVRKLGLLQPESGVARTKEEARAVCERIGFPVLVRPSYVLGGRAMEIVYSVDDLDYYMENAVKVSFEHPVLIDRYLENAIEVDVDAVSDGCEVFVAGVMEHIEEAGIHSGDSSCSIPPYSLPHGIVSEIERQTVLLARELNTIGLINCQFAVKEGRIYILEVNPRASRTVPFVSKTIGVQIAKVAAKVILGCKLKDMELKGKRPQMHTAIKVPVFPFLRFPGIDTLLGPEMKSTGEVMGIDMDFPSAFYKGWIASGNSLKKGGAVFISVKDTDKEAAVELAKHFLECGFRVVSTRGTAGYLAAKGVEVEVVNKVREGRPHIVDMLYNGEISLVVNTPFGRQSVHDSYSIRRTSLTMGIPIITTISGARAALAAISRMKDGEMKIKSIQEYQLNE